MEQSLDTLKRKKRHMEEALKNANFALSHDDYKNPYEFKRMDKMTGEEFAIPTLSSIVKKCIERDIGFDPNLLLQHIEKEMLEQFNEICLKHIKGSSIKTLMGMRHSLELFILNDQVTHYTSELKQIDKMILDKMNNVPSSETVIDDNILSISSNRTTNNLEVDVGIIESPKTDTPSKSESKSNKKK